MFYIKKQPESPAEFSNAIAGLERYEELKDDNRKKVMALLTKEQGGLCAICERRADKIGMTIEHFLPKSFFPDLQLSYSNLYACCNKCNEPKAEHLIPSYIFDPRFSPFYISKSNVRVLKPIYDFNSDAETCRVIVPEAMSMKEGLNSTRQSAYIMQATLDLLVQNRNENAATEKEYEVSLLHSRGGVMKILRSQNLSREKWQAKYDALQQKYENQADDYPAFISIFASFFRKKLKM